MKNKTFKLLLISCLAVAISLLIGLSTTVKAQGHNNYDEHICQEYSHNCYGGVDLDSFDLNESINEPLTLNHVTGDFINSTCHGDGNCDASGCTNYSYLGAHGEGFNISYTIDNSAINEPGKEVNRLKIINLIGGDFR